MPVNNRAAYATAVISYGEAARVKGDDSVVNQIDPTWATAESAVRSVRLAPSTWDPKTFTVEVVAATDTPVARRDKAGAYAERLDMTTLDLTSAKDLPVFFAHRPAGTSREIAGIVQSLRVESGQLLATLRLSQADDNLPLIQRVADGTVTGVSIGYLVTAWSESREGGLRVKSPKAWTISEISFTPNPADPNSRVRSLEHAQMPDPTLNDAATLERTRRTDIRLLVRTAGLSADVADDLIDDGADLGTAKATVFDAMQARPKPIIRTHAAHDDPALTRSRRADALHCRVTGEAPKDDVRPYMADTLRDHARAAVEAAGVSARAMGTETLFRSAMHSTSDFPNLLTGTGNRTLMAAYQAAQSPIKATIARQATIADFRPKTMLRLSDVGPLSKVAENGEITSTTRGEAKESYGLDTYATLFGLSQKALINDDLGAFRDWGQTAGRMAAETEANLIWKLLDSNPVMGEDGLAMFHATHGNLEAQAPILGELSVASLTNARQAMRKMKGLDKRTPINATPRYLVVGPALETKAEQILATLAAATVADVNPFAARLTLLVEPRIAAGAVAR